MRDFVTVPVIMSADVAANTTFTVGYPANYNAGDFQNATEHFMSINGTKYRWPNDIGLSFGASAVTVTNRTTDTIPQGAKGNFQFDILGKEVPIKALNDLGRPKTVHAQTWTPILREFGAVAAAISNGICLSQAVNTTTALLNGSLVTTGVANFDMARNVVAAWTTAAILTVKGYDEYDNPMTEQSASGTSFTGKKAFKKVTSASFNANVTGATIGTGVVLGLPVRVLLDKYIVQEFENGIPLGKRAQIERMEFFMTGTELDTPSTRYLFPGVAGTITKFGAVSQAATTTGGAVKLQITGVDVTTGAITLANADAAGTEYSTVPTAANVFGATDYIDVVPAGAINGSGGLAAWVEFEATSDLKGTFVAGLAVNTKSTATTGDVRGTYSPRTTPDGTTTLELLISLPDPDDLGSTQYSV